MAKILKKLFLNHKAIPLMLSLSIVTTVMFFGCDNAAQNTSQNITTEHTNQTTAMEFSGSMESVFVDSKYVSGNTIDEFIENEQVKELIVITKSSKDDDSIVSKQIIQRNGTEYVSNGKTYKYFYKLTRHSDSTVSQVYILSNIVFTEDEYDDYLSNSTITDNSPLIVATNISTSN